MAIVLTNGEYFIAHSKTGAVIKVSDIKQAQDFYTVEKAEAQKNKTPGKCFSYYWIDTDETPVQPVEQDIQPKPKRIKKKSAVKRKQYSVEERKEIYDRANGCCQLCGRKIAFEDMTVDHIIPISIGGADKMENLQCTCFADNQFKSNILPEQFFDRITEIFMFQMEKNHGDNLDWKISRNLLMGIL